MRTRRSKSWVPEGKKIQVDNAGTKGVTYGEQGTGGMGNTEGIKIDDDVWAEFVSVGKLLCLKKENPDTYDLFDWVRVNLNGGQHYSESFLAKIDAEIAKEFGPWDMS